MKKVLLGVIAIIAIAVVVVVINQPKGKDVLNLIPAEAVFVVKANNLSKEVEYWKNRPFVKKIKSLDIEKIMIDAASTKQQVAEYKNFCKEFDKIFSTVNIKLADQILGDEVAFAFLGNPIDYDSLKTGESENFNKSLASNFLLVSRPKNSTILGMLDSIISTDKIKTENYKENDIKTITIKKEMGVAISYVLVDGNFILGANIDTVKKSIDNLKNKDFASIAKSKKFTDANKNLHSDYDQLSYIDLAKYNELLEPMQKMQMNIIKNSGNKHLEKFITILNEVYKKTDMITVSTGKRIGNEHQVKQNSTYNLKDYPEFAKVLEFSPLKSSNLSIIPENAILALSQSINIKEIIGFAKFAGAPIDMIKPQFKQFTNVEFDTFIAALGDSISFVLNDVKLGGMFPMPEISLMLDIKDEKIISSIIDRLLMTSPMPIGKEKIGTGEISSVTLPIGIKPSYTFYSKNLIISSDIEALKKLLDADKNNKSLKSNKFFSSKITGAITFNINKVFSKASEFVKSKPMPKKSPEGIIINQVVFPILDALKEDFNKIEQKIYMDKTGMFAEGIFK